MFRSPIFFYRSIEIIVTKISNRRFPSIFWLLGCNLWWWRCKDWFICILKLNFREFFINWFYEYFWIFWFTWLFITFWMFSFTWFFVAFYMSLSVFIDAETRSSQDKEEPRHNWKNYYIVTLLRQFLLKLVDFLF